MAETSSYKLPRTLQKQLKVFIYDAAHFCAIMQIIDSDFQIDDHPQPISERPSNETEERRASGVSFHSYKDDNTGGSATGPKQQKPQPNTKEGAPRRKIGPQPVDMSLSKPIEKGETTEKGGTRQSSKAQGAKTIKGINPPQKKKKKKWP